MRVICVAVSVSLASAPAFAQPVATEPGPAPDEGHRSWLVGPYTSAGLTFMSLGEDSFAPGLGLEAGFGVRLDPRVALNASLVWGFTEFDRTLEWWDAGTELGGKTTDGYRAVTRWAGDCSDEYKGLCYLGAFFAYAILSFGYAGAAGIYLGGPLASTGHLGLNFTASYLFGDEDNGARLELGASTAVLFPREYPEALSVVGPSFALIGRTGRYRLGVRVAWFPTAIRVSGERDRAALVGLVTAGVER